MKARVNGFSDDVLIVVEKEIFLRLLMTCKGIGGMQDLKPKLESLKDTFLLIMSLKSKVSNQNRKFT